MKVRMLRDTIVGGRVAAVGEVVDVTDNEAQILLHAKKAEKVQGPPERGGEKATREPRETAEDPRRPPRR